MQLSDIQAFLDNPEQLANQPVQFQLAVANYSLTPRSLLEVLYHFRFWILDNGIGKCLSVVNFRNSYVAAIKLNGIVNSPDSQVAEVARLYVN